ncbi:hypothetical protein [Hafnia sp.]|uniref:hypothetical protein n=1 Tax=Hafnia sp. TaxID=1873498 RepID=UPI002FCB2799
MCLRPSGVEPLLEGQQQRLLRLFGHAAFTAGDKATGAKGQCRFAPARFVIAAGSCSSTLTDFPL